MGYIIIWFLFGLFSSLIASSKGRSGSSWFLLGMLLGPFALLVAFLPSTSQMNIKKAQDLGEYGDYKKCPFCAEVIRQEAIKCRYCGTELPQHSPTAIEKKEKMEEDGKDYKNSLAYKAGKLYNRHFKKH